MVNYFTSDSRWWRGFLQDRSLLFGRAQHQRSWEIVDRLLASADCFGLGFALGMTFYLYKHPEFGPLVGEVTDELSKVTWPRRGMKPSNTLVTSRVTVIIAAILWVSTRFLVD